VIHLLYGKDGYRARARLREIRDQLAAGDDMLSSNTTVLAGASTTPEELLAHASATPFLSAHRLVIVEGLLVRLSRSNQERKPRGKGKQAPADDPLEAWRPALSQLADASVVPETTTIVFVEATLDERNAALTLVKGVAKAERFDELKDEALRKWTMEQASGKGIRLEPRAGAVLAQAVGADLWALDNELEKLAAYAEDGAVDAETAERVVAPLQGAKWWDLTDAVAAGNEKKALSALRRLLSEGEPPPMLSVMLARQYRQLAQAKDLRERRARDAEIAKVIGAPEWKAGQVATQAQRYSWGTLRTAYRLLVEADLGVKRGLQDGESALQLVIHELCALAPAGAGGYRRPAARSG
jgi:DNA polymerase-3 subunit delta